MLLADIIRKVHKNKMLVIWEWHKQTFAELKDFGIDGFEIYNCGYRNFREDDCRSLINFSQKAFF
ncbi:hypothetical protein ATZ36_16170 [Candidatus Endomicrobiellum trichonymphae]|uniref:Uncharacterized protein n=1 Tax=Endomicrobium trichonymphae TaxID=1408204 RepID=A0A1E5IKA3_ENDTX|nr:hypothetical protein ATZ36_18015 [Candidatus Endomicrobium trichonymphae]OEG71092.1 hypothetical protein ATZ36_16170 [Candidatus Endomicrobium trichonymphae]